MHFARPRLCLVFVALACAAAEHRLAMESSAWVAKVFPDGSYSEREAATLEISEGELRAGPWRGGKWSARLEYRQRLPLLCGSLKLRYRTEELLPYQAVVRIGFDDASPISFWLPASTEWRDYVVPVRRAPNNTRGVNIGIGLSAWTEGRLFVRDVVLTDETFITTFPAVLPGLTRPAPPLRFDSRRFIGLTQHEGTWWFVRPDGTSFFAWATDGPSPDSARDMSTGARYLESMRALHFNSLGGWTSITPWASVNRALVAKGEPPLAMFRSLQTGTMQGEYDRLIEGDHAFPDPFDPRWEQVLRARFRSMAAPVRDEAWFAAWFADNEADHRDLHRNVYKPNCSAALRQYLEERYEGSIGALNKQWGASYASFEALIAAKPDPQLRTGPMYEDFRAFKRRIVQRYVNTLVSVMREEDPNHLIFSNRFMLGDSSEWLDVIDLYAAFDGIGLNIYPANLSAGLNESEHRIYELVYERTGKPVVVPEWSVPALDSGLYNNPQRLDWSYPQAVENQTERAHQAAAILTTFYNMPFIAGAHWFIWKDIDNPTRQANRGLFKASGEPWTELQQALAAAAAHLP